MAGKIFVGSKLPHGLILSHPISGEKVLIRGMNDAPMGTNGVRMLVPYVTTSIDKDFWDAWMLTHGGKYMFPALKSGAIWNATTADAIKGKYKDREKDLTGVQPMAREGDERMGREGKGLKQTTGDDE